MQKIPKFKNEDEEIEFWDTHDLTDYLHVFKPVKLDFSKLKPSTAKVTLRLPQMKIFLSQRIKEEYYSKNAI